MLSFNDYHAVLIIRIIHGKSIWRRESTSTNRLVFKCCMPKFDISRMMQQEGHLTINNFWNTLTDTHTHTHTHTQIFIEPNIMSKFINCSVHHMVLFSDFPYQAIYAIYHVCVCVICWNKAYELYLFIVYAVVESTTRPNTLTTSLKSGLLD